MAIAFSVGADGMTVQLDLFNTGRDSVRCERKKWGAFDIVICAAYVDGAPHLSNSFLDDLNIIKQFRDKGII